MFVYVDDFRTGCDSRTELEDLWSKHFIDPVIRDTVEDLLSVEVVSFLLLFDHVD